MPLSVNNMSFRGKITFLALLPAVLAGCSKVDTAVRQEPVFRANVLSAVSAGPLPDGMAVTVRAYRSGDIGTLSASADYTAQSGTLQKNAGGIALDEGTYDFYAYAPAGLPFSGVSDRVVCRGLVNGVDYLWAGTSTRIEENALNVGLNFEHRAVKLSFVIYPGEGLSTVDELTAAALSVPDPGACVMDLATGEIEPSEAVGPEQTMHILPEKTDGAYPAAEMIILPLSGTQDRLVLRFSARTDGNPEAEDFVRTDFPVYPGGFLAGKEYQYKVYLKSGGRPVFSVPEVVDWELEDRTGTPIVPVPQLTDRK